MLFILEPDGLAPLPVTSPPLLDVSYPASPPGRTYPQLKLLCGNLLMKDWEEAAPDPARYKYCPSLKPYHFMGPSKFDAGRLHERRSGKSYLRAPPSWDDTAPTTCPSCGEAPGTFKHAILHCPAKRPARTRHLQGVTDIGPDAAVWLAAALLGALTGFVRSMALALPRSMFSRPNSSPDSVSSPSSNVVSFGYFLSSQESSVYVFCFLYTVRWFKVGFL